MLYRIFAPFLMFVTFTGCGLDDNLAPIPTYLILENPSVDPGTTPGGDTHKITDVWVYSDGQLQGIFPLPAKVPVIATNEESEIIILAGIRKNGILDEPAFYPFYQSITRKVVLEEQKEITIPLRFVYAEDCTFELIADFEFDNLLNFNLDGDTSTNIKVTSEDAASGNKSGKVVLTGSSAVLEVATGETFNKLSQISGSAYIEMDYKGTADIGIGLVTFDEITPGGQLQYKVVVVPRNNWNKVYIDITQEISSPRLKAYKLALAFTVPAGQQSAEAYIDNVKMIRYQ